MDCTAVPDCEAEATQRFTWAWGEDGACCDAHRAIVESQAAQLQRSVMWAPLAPRDDGDGPKTDPGRNARTVDDDPSELFEMRSQVAELARENQRLQAALATAADPETRDLHRAYAEAQREIESLTGKVTELEGMLRNASAPAESVIESVIEGAAKGA